MNSLKVTIKSKFFSLSAIGRCVLSACAVLFFYSVVISSSFADVVVLKNGNIHEGKIIYETEIFVRLRPKDIKEADQNFLRENIEDIYHGDEYPEGLTRPTKIFQEKSLRNTVSTDFISQEESTQSKSWPPKKPGTFRIDKNLGQSTEILSKNFSAHLSSIKGGSGAAMADLQRQMNAQIKDQLPQLIWMFVRMLLGFLLVIGIIAWIINRFIDGGPGDDPVAGFWRRLAAYMIDSSIGSVIIGIVIILPGLVVPLDTAKAIPVYIIAVLILGVYTFYMVFGYVKFSNTYGRYVMNVKVVDYLSGDKLRYGQAFVRMLGYIFWPIEAMIVLLSRSKRRMGDVWAGTRVKLIQNEISWFKRIKVGAAIVILGYMLLYVIVPISNGKTIIAEAGRDYLNRNNVQFLNNPQGVNIQSSPQGTYGTVIFKLIDDNGRSIVLSFSYKNDRWIFQKRRYIKQHVFGLFTYNY